MSNFTVEVTNLTRLYGGKAVVNNVSFNLMQGQVLGFLGPNGAGKSTTMKMLTGNLAPSTGSIKICGVNIIDKPKEAKALIGYLPELRPLYKELTVNEYLTLAARLHNVRGNHTKKAVENAKELCGLAHMSNRLIDNLSNGYQQRAGIAQAIIHNPMVVILDEPTVGLDPIQIRDLRALIKEIGRTYSVILSTHILPEVEIVCNHVQIIDKGKLVFNGDIEVFKRQRIGNKLLVGFRKPPNIVTLEKIQGITRIEALKNNMLRIAFAEDAQPHEKIVEISVESGWDLHQIAPDQSTLEDVFMHLTHQEITQQNVETA